MANTHTVQSLEIGYDNYNRVNRLVQSLEDQRQRPDWCMVMHQRHSDRDYLMTYCRWNTETKFGL